jgi:hypothetical protein
MSESPEAREARRKAEAKLAHEAYMREEYVRVRAEIERREREELKYRLP